MPSLVVSPVRTRSVEVVRWPVDTERRAACAEAGVACLLAVRRGEPIPALLADEDWIYDDADERDVANRLERLAAHAPGGGASVAPAPGNPGALAVSVSVPVVPAGLTTVEHRVARRLLTSMGTLVARTELPGDDLDSVIAVLQMAFRDHGLQIQPVADAGYLVHPLEPDGVAELS